MPLPFANASFLRDEPHRHHWWMAAVSAVGSLRVVEDPAELAELLDQLRNELLIAVDTEAASFHRYFDRIYLLQLSTRTTTWIIDPLAIEGLPGLENLLADPGIEFVFHDADYDLRLLAHEFGYRPARIFDTRVAAQFLNEPGVGLAALLAKHFGVTLDKRFQRADWSGRPIAAQLLEYAATDTRYLPELRDLLHQRLLTAGRLSWVEEECALLREVRWPEPEPPAAAALGAKGARALNPRGLAVFRELYVWRDELARELDRAPFRIVGNEALVAMARFPPTDLDELRRVRGLGREARERHSGAIIAAIKRALAFSDAELPRFPRPPRHRPDAAFTARLERLRSARARDSERLELPLGLLAPNWLLEAIARRAPTTLEELGAIPGMRRWQVAVLGEDLLAEME